MNMPTNLVHTKRDERLWNEAKKQAAKQGRAEDWAYVVGIFQRMKGVSKSKQKDLIPGGLADKKKPEDFDPEDLKAGVKVEREHTSNPAIATEIAMDHLTEDPKYYKKLKRMEKSISVHPMYATERMPFMRLEIPPRLDPDVEAMLKPRDFDAKALLLHDGVMLRPQAVSGNLGLDTVKEMEWTHRIEMEGNSAPNEAVFRQAIHAALRDETWDPELKSAFMARALQYYRSLRKSLPGPRLVIKSKLNPLPRK